MILDSGNEFKVGYSGIQVPLVSTKLYIIYYNDHYMIIGSRDYPKLILTCRGPLRIVYLFFEAPIKVKSNMLF